MNPPSQNPRRTRFAPSPTGYLHLGHAYSAFRTWNFAENNDAEIILRIEDIDHTRCSNEFERAIFEDLKWLGLTWEGAIRRQSEYIDVYEKAIKELSDRGLTYPCFCTRKEILVEINESPSAPHGPFGPIYPGICKRLSEDERQMRLAKGDAFAIRLDMTVALREAKEPLTFEECVEGPDGESGTIAATPHIAGDFVLARKDIPTSYHVSVVVDDHVQGITDIIRGQDLFFATHIHRLLQDLWGYATPHYHHHALLKDPSGRRFAKRDKDQTLKSMREAGSTPVEITDKIKDILTANATSHSDR